MSVFKNILHTAGTRILNALFNLVILILITHTAGSKGLGLISLIVLDITVIQLIMGLIAGGSLIYFASRYRTIQLLFISYVWIILTTVLFFILGQMWMVSFPVFYGKIVPQSYAADIICLGLLNGFMQIHYNLLIGQKQIGIYNRIFTLQISLFLISFAWQLFFLGTYGPIAYVHSLYLSWGTGSLLGLFYILKNTKNYSLYGWTKVLTNILHYGMPTQAAVMLHIGNKRLSFYFIRLFAGLAPLGIYNAGVQLTEGLRLIGQSISLVQYSSISNSRSREYARQLTIQLMKFTFILTFLALMILFFIPESLYSLAFSSEFSVVKMIVLVLSPGVLALGANTIFSHYFSGMGQPAVNLYANIIGFVFTVLFAFLLIPPFGYMGAAATASVNYSASAVYQYFIFRKRTRTRFSEWFLRKNDVTGFAATLGQLFRQKNAHQ